MVNPCIEVEEVGVSEVSEDIEEEVLVAVVEQEVVIFLLRFLKRVRRRQKLLIVRS